MDMNVSFKIAAGVTGQQAVDSLKTSMEKLGDSAVVVGKGTLSLANNFTALANPIDFATGLLSKFAGVAGLAGAVTGMISLTNKAIDAGAELATLSIKTGISVETLSRFSTIAKLADTDMASVAGTLKKLSNSAVDAANGNTKLESLFKAVGVSVRDANGNIRASDELLVDLARTVQGIQPEIVTKLMTELAGKNGAEIIPFLRELNERLDETKVKVTEDFAIAAKEYKDNLILLQGNVSALGRALANDLLPALVRVTDEMVRAKSEGFFTQAWRGLSGAVIEASTDFKDVDGEINKVNTRLESLRSTLKSFQNAGSWSRWWNADDIKILQGQIGMNEQALRMLESQKKRVAEAKPLNPVATPESQAKTAAIESVLKEQNTKAERTGVDPYVTELQSLGREAAKLRFNSEHVKEFQDRITSAKEAQIMFDIEQGKFKDLTAAQKQNLLEAARAVDKYGVSLKENLAGFEYEKQTKRIEAETRALGQSNLVRAETLALQDLEAKGIKEGTELYERLKESRLSALRTQYEESRSFSTGIKQFMTEYAEDASNSAKHVKDSLTGAFNAASDAIVDFAMTGKFNFSSFANSILKDMARIALQRSILGPIAQGLSGLFGGGGGSNIPGWTPIPVPEANGDAFSGGRIIPFATGGVVNSPTYFPMANGMGLMGEAGPEAIMPLKRDSSGRLGVRAAGAGGGDQYNISVTVASDGTTNTKGDGTGEGLGRAIAGAVRQEIMNQKRPGGLLAAGAIA